MARLVAGSGRTLNMSRALDLLDSDLALSRLMSISPDGGHTLWQLGSRGLVADVAVTFTDPAFSARLTNLELHSTVSESTGSLLWKLTGIPVSVVGSFEVSGSNIAITVDVPGIWHGVVTVNASTESLVSFTDTFTGYYDSFVPYVFRKADTISGSTGNDNLRGFGGNDTLDGGGGADRLDGGGGADRLLGGWGKDLLIWRGNDAKLDGGGGTDTLKLAIDLDLTGVSNATIVNVERIDMKGGGSDSLTLNKSDVLDMSPNDTLKVLGDAGDIVHRGAGWSGGSIVSGFRTYTQGAATLLVDSDITCVV